MKFLKGTSIYSILTGTCPVCQNESMYKNTRIFAIKNVLGMNERCNHCHTKYSMEPSFFYGAMYVSYGVGVAFGVAAFIISHYFFNLNLLTSYFVIVGTILICLPIILRLSRNIWINLFMSYDESKDKKRNN
ncbi:DUF983 domain-containing protein [Aquimarina agarivorans]|uniref:DUF983 domain-containing protein n=1 Tax=Aquimarina agarivorans TaxID=980584 RepID=UPI000248FD4D|nr:DUF983 domain-containing protein [Aquimarina agarivorans]